MVQLLLHNIKKEGSINKLQDIIIVKYSQLFSEYCQENKEMIGEFLRACIGIFGNRLNLAIVNSVKGYSKTQKPIYLTMFPLCAKTIEKYDLREFVQEIGDSLQQSLMWEKITSVDGLRSSLDLEFEMAMWLLGEQQIDVVINYWNLLNRNINLYQYEDLIFETRQRIMSMIIKHEQGVEALIQLSK